MNYSIAIDGPAGAGKSTIAKAVARKLHYIYVDTGAMYRAMALFILRNGVSPQDGASISSCCRQADISIAYENGEQVVLLNGENVNDLIRTEEVGNMASEVSVYPDVRKKLVELQQKLAASQNVIMDGRDIGTCVLPEATAKIFLTASTAVRARRRFEELKGKGQEVDLAEIEEYIRVRDERDYHREISPLRQAQDAVLLDSSDMTVEEVIGRILEIAGRKGCR